MDAPQQTPAVTAQSLAEASRNGRDALRAFLCGPQTQPLTRAQQISRVREATQLLPTLQLTVEQRRLVMGVTRQILQQLSDDVRGESQNQVGERLLKLQAEQKEIAAARNAVLLQEATNVPLTVLNAIQPQGATTGGGRGFWNWFMSASTAIKAGVIVGGIAAFVAIRKLWKKIHWAIRTGLLVVGGYLGILWLLRRFGRGGNGGGGSGGGAGPGVGPGNIPGGLPVQPPNAPLVVPDQPSAIAPTQQPGNNPSVQGSSPPAVQPPTNQTGPQSGTAPAEGNEGGNARDIHVRVLGDSSERMDDNGDFQIFLYPGASEPMTTEQLVTRVRGLFGQGIQPTLVLHSYGSSVGPSLYMSQLRDLVAAETDSNGRIVRPAIPLLHRSGEYNEPRPEDSELQTPRRFHVAILKREDAENDSEGQPKLFCIDDNFYSLRGVIALMRQLQGQRIVPAVRFRCSANMNPDSTTAVVQLQRELGTLNIAHDLERAEQQPLRFHALVRTTTPIDRDSQGNNRYFRLGSNERYYSLQELIHFMERQRQNGYATRLILTIPFSPTAGVIRSDHETIVRLRKSCLDMGSPLVIRE